MEANPQFRISMLSFEYLVFYSFGLYSMGPFCNPLIFGCFAFIRIFDFPEHSITSEIAYLLSSFPTKLISHCRHF